MLAKNKKAVVITVPSAVITSEAPEKKATAKFGTPVANMWWNHTPKPSAMVLTVLSATAV